MNKPEHHGTRQYAAVNWAAVEVVGIAGQDGVSLTTEAAQRFLERYEIRIKQVMIKAAYDDMRYLFQRWPEIQEALDSPSA